MPEESLAFVCQNPRCRREIQEPVLLTNLSVTPPEQYDACPYCFTKLEPKATVNQEFTDRNEDMEKANDADSQFLKKVEDIILNSNANQQKEKKISDCPQVFGYLGSRPAGAPIPQECLVCKRILDCMRRSEE